MKAASGLVTRTAPPASSNPAGVCIQATSATSGTAAAVAIVAASTVAVVTAACGSRLGPNIAAPVKTMPARNSSAGSSRPAIAAAAGPAAFASPGQPVSTCSSVPAAASAASAKLSANSRVQPACARRQPASPSAPWRSASAAAIQPSPIATVANTTAAESVAPRPMRASSSGSTVIAVPSCSAEPSPGAG